MEGLATDTGSADEFMAGLIGGAPATRLEF